MRYIFKSFLVAILSVGLIGIPSFAANEKPLGLVTQAQEAHLGSATVAIGTTVYPGDTLATDEGGRNAGNAGPDVPGNTRSPALANGRALRRLRHRS